MAFKHNSPPPLPPKHSPPKKKMKRTAPAPASAPKAKVAKPPLRAGDLTEFVNATPSGQLLLMSKDKYKMILWGPSKDLVLDSYPDDFQGTVQGLWEVLEAEGVDEAPKYLAYATDWLDMDDGHEPWANVPGYECTEEYTADADPEVELDLGDLSNSVLGYSKKPKMRLAMDVAERVEGYAHDADRPAIVVGAGPKGFTTKFVVPSLVDAEALRDFYQDNDHGQFLIVNRDMEFQFVLWAPRDELDMDPQGAAGDVRASITDAMATVSSETTGDVEAFMQRYNAAKYVVFVSKWQDIDDYEDPWSEGVNDSDIPPELVFGVVEKGKVCLLEEMPEFMLGDTCDFMRVEATTRGVEKPALVLGKGPKDEFMSLVDLDEDE